MNKQDITVELRKWADAPIKSPAISKALREAALEIERLRDLLLEESDKTEDLRYKISKIRQKLQETVTEVYRA